MGDHRPVITAHFEMHGHVADYDFGWCNWSDNGQGIDQRIIDWFADQAAIAMANYHEAINEADAIRRKAETERLERQELERLKAKYDKSPSGV